MLPRHVAIAGPLLIFALCSINAQDRGGLIDASGSVESDDWLAGVTASYARNHHTGGFRTVTYDEPHPVFDEGLGSGFQIGATAEYLLSRCHSIDMRLMYDVRPARFQVPYGSLVLDPNSQDVYTDSTAFADIDYRLFTADLMVSTRVVAFSRHAFLSLSLGPSVGVVSTAELSRWSTGYLSGTRNVHYEGRKLDDHNDWRVAVKAGAGVDVRISDRVWTHMRAHYDMGLGDVTTTGSWQLSSVLFQIDVLMML